MDKARLLQCWENYKKYVSNSARSSTTVKDTKTQQMLLLGTEELARMLGRAYRESLEDDKDELRELRDTGKGLPSWFMSGGTNGKGGKLEEGGRCKNNCIQVLHNAAILL